MAMSVGDFSENVPETYEDAIDQENYGELGWKQAIKQELEALENNNTWTIVPKENVPKEDHVIDSKWIFKEKDLNGVRVKKARLVARGYQQTDFSEEVYAPVSRMVTIRVLFSLAVKDNLVIHQLDVKSAFLNGTPVYMYIPKGCLLMQTLYVSCKNFYMVLSSHQNAGMKPLINMF